MERMGYLTRCRAWPSCCSVRGVGCRVFLTAMSTCTHVFVCVFVGCFADSGVSCGVRR